MSSTILRARERFWADRYEALNNAGYLLRPRYHPDWKPSWKDGEFSQWAHEDSYVSFLPKVMDAMKQDESKKVVLKHITDENELSILQKLLSITDDRNHTVALIDVVRLQKGCKWEIFIVMPFLRTAFASPSFEKLGEILDAVHQFLLGLEFIHEQNVAHRDACYGNLMVDASSFIPVHHFVEPDTIDTIRPIKPLPRSSAAPIKYYFIDFGLSVYCPPGKAPTAMGKVGQDRTVPELQDEERAYGYDPFKLDIYQLGNTFAKDVFIHYVGLEFLRPLTDHMTRPEPSQRPTAKEARELFESLTEQCDRQDIICLQSDWRIDWMIVAIKNRFRRWRSQIHRR
ncbi:hypothetical protein C8J57DRAFT_1321006 [Mycena rebaudengoi]|nr:hypothetical protein C8J57DRAFT_1321006 [Mycena rebaudengoi]